ncbi:MAG: hypothetical protein IJ099_07720 [Alphaproteobacteria bacterium]|nr:hypothetical protein [Alphaproteobacteria bacterium]
MADIDTDFRRFLESYKATRNLLEQYDQAKTEEEKSRLLAKMQSEYGAKYISWSKLPIEIKEKYQNSGAPDWVIEIAAERSSNELLLLAEHPEINSRDQFDKVMREEEQKTKEAYEKMRADFVAGAEAIAVVAAPIVLAGYAQKAANELAEERLFRDEFFAKLGNRKPTFAELGIILNSQQKTWKIIHDEWREHMPERYLLRLLAKYNRGKISEEQLMPQLADVIQRIHTEGHDEHLAEYLNRPLVRAKLRHFKPEKMDELLEMVGKQIYGGNRHQKQMTNQQLKEKLTLNVRDLPEDIMTILKQVREAQEISNSHVKPLEKTNIRVAKINTK